MPRRSIQKRPTRWACQRHSITEQLQKGIRLLDIRLKPKRRRDEHTTQPTEPNEPNPPNEPTQPTQPNEPANHETNSHERITHEHTTPRPRHTSPGHTHDNTPQPYQFITCHGHLGPFGANEFQPFDEIAQECTAFLKANPRETIIMTIQIDDWRQTARQDQPQILKALQANLTRLPLLLTPQMPTLKECRGRIFLINRINDDPNLGVPIDIPNNTPGEILTSTNNRHYEVYVQDQYKNLNRGNPEAHKLRLTTTAFERKRPGVMLLNYASGTKPFGRFVYIMKELLEYFKTSANPKPPASHTAAATSPASHHRAKASPADHPQTTAPLGWLLLDYPLGTARQTTPDLPALIIASNDH